jgi:hypothetical protein
MALFVVRHFSAMFILLAFSAPLLFCLAKEEDSSQLGTRQDNSHVSKNLNFNSFPASMYRNSYMGISLEISQL